MDKINFSPVVYGEIRPYNDVLSQARCRIFYKYKNRNGTYITNEFADKLIPTLPYVPIKGIYDEGIEDFEGHGKSRTEGRIYGIVPENPNFAWEDHLDEDGVTRTYACCDVLLFTAMYKEASDIIGKAQSMELYPPTVKGKWEYIEGQRLYVLTDGVFLGLMTLGDDHTPCFEGAAFYSLYSSLKEIMESINYNLNDGGNNMGNNEPITEPVVDPVQEPATDPVQDPIVDPVDPVEEPAVDPVEPTQEPTDPTEPTADPVVDPTDDPAPTADPEPAADPVDPAPTYEALQEQILDLEQRIVEYEGTISTLNTEIENSRATYETRISALEAENTQLSQYKAEAEGVKRTALISKYSAKLSQDTIDEIVQSAENYSLVELEKEFAFALVNSDQTLFAGAEGVLIPKQEPLTGLGAILAKYEK